MHLTSFGVTTHCVFIRDLFVIQRTTVGMEVMRDPSVVWNYHFCFVFWQVFFSPSKTISNIVVAYKMGFAPS